MASVFRGLLLASLSVSVIAVAACSSTGTSNMTNQSEASRVDAILERAAREAKASGNKVETVILLEKIYQRSPDDAAVATSFGQALREDDQLNRARQVLYPFTEGKNAYPDAVTELSMVQIALGQYKEAELTARRAVEMDEKSGRAFLALGTALDAQNYHEQAEVAFRRGIDNWKGDPAPIMNNLALNLASQNKLDQAVDMLEKAQEISPGRIELERNMRIIKTLRESADDFLVKQAAEKDAAAAKKKEMAEKPVEKKEEPKKEAAKKEQPKKENAKKELTQDEKDNKQLSKKADNPKDITNVEPAATDDNTNMRGSRQNFNTKSQQPGNQ